MKKKLLVLVLSAVMAVGMMSGCGAKSDTSEGEAKVEQDASSKEGKKEETPKCELEDGTYTAEFKTDSGMFHVNAANDGKGTLTVKDGKIEAVEVTSAEKEDSAYLAMAEDIIPKIIEAQSAEVDTISGATFSSAGIKNAAEQALEQAVK